MRCPPRQHRPSLLFFIREQKAQLLEVGSILQLKRSEPRRVEAHEEDPGPLPGLRGMQKAARAESGGPAQGRNCPQDPSSTEDACLQSGGGFHPNSTPNKLRKREEQATVGLDVGQHKRRN